MNSETALKHFEETNALLNGHFILTSGLHSSQYLQCALALQYPADAARFGQSIAEMFTESRIDTVVSPAIGGLVIGYAVAAALNSRFVWVERQNEQMVLRRGFQINPGERILVIEDVMTTGGTTKEAINCLKDLGAEVVAAATIVDRSNGKANVGVDRRSLITLDVASYAPPECPMCKAGLEAVKPGSRKS